MGICVSHSAQDNCNINDFWTATHSIVEWKKQRLIALSQSIWNWSVDEMLPEENFEDPYDQLIQRGQNIATASATVAQLEQLQQDENGLVNAYDTLRSDCNPVTGQYSKTDLHNFCQTTLTNYVSDCNKLLSMCWQLTIKDKNGQQ